LRNELGRKDFGDLLAISVQSNEEKERKKEKETIGQIWNL
jgi:hypothetical protein